MSCSVTRACCSRRSTSRQLADCSCATRSASRSPRRPPSSCCTGQRDYFPRLTSIIVYPTGYLAGGSHVEGGIWSEGEEHLLGHTQRDLRALVLAWDEVQAGAADPYDGQNLVLHEFAHQLDFEDGSTDGTPALDTGAQMRAWATVLGDELEALRQAADAGEPTLLDPYGAEDAAEFFAVATETFFERAEELSRQHPRLYAELRRFYAQDPVAWQPRAS